MIRSGVTPKYFARGRLAEAAEAGDHFVENQQDAVLRADLAQLLQIALRRNQHAGRAGHRLDDHRGDRRRVVQRDDAFEFVGEMRAPCGLALRERVVFEVVRVRQVIDRRQQRARERLAIRRDAAHRNAAEAHAVIAALAADQPRALRLRRASGGTRARSSARYRPIPNPSS